MSRDRRSRQGGTRPRALVSEQGRPLSRFSTAVPGEAARRLGDGGLRRGAVEGLSCRRDGCSGERQRRWVVGGLLPLVSLRSEGRVAPDCWNEREDIDSAWASTSQLPVRHARHPDLAPSTDGSFAIEGFHCLTPYCCRQSSDKARPRPSRRRRNLCRYQARKRAVNGLLDDEEPVRIPYPDTVIGFAAGSRYQRLEAVRDPALPLPIARSTTPPLPG